MLTFIEFILVMLSGFCLTHLTSKENRKSPLASFFAMCFGTAFLLTFFLAAVFWSSIAQHIYTVIVCLLAIGKIKEYRDKTGKQ